MPTYNIVISESQRVSLINVLKAANLPAENWDTMLDQLFVSCLESLPEMEKEDPGVNHGFCY